MQRPQCTALLALDVKLDRPAADRTVLDIRRLFRRQIDARVQSLAAIRATHCNELLGRYPSALGGLPYRLETVELVDARLVETRDAAPEKLEGGGFVSFHHLRCRLAAAMLRQRLQRGYAKMPILRAAVVLLCAVAALGGCSGGGLKPDAPQGANLAGSWKLDHSASDDPQKILSHMRTEATRIVNRQLQAQAQAQGQSAPVFHGDPLRRSPMAHIIEEAAARGEFLTIRQDAGEFVLDYGTTRRTFTPGAHSVVSAEGGVGDQTSGWKGREYVIEIRGQASPDITESYGLSEDGKHLVQKLHVASGELPAVTLTRVFNPTNETAPRQLPNND